MTPGSPMLETLPGPAPRRAPPAISRPDTRMGRTQSIRTSHDVAGSVGPAGDSRLGSM